MDKEKEHMSRLKDVVDMKVQKVASPQEESPGQFIS